MLREVRVDGDDDGSVLLGHGRDSVAVVRVRQVFLGVHQGLQHQGLAVPVAPAVAPVAAELAAPAAAADVERGARETEAGLSGTTQGLK